MINKVFVIAALLVPGLAYGANPSANLSVQIVPAGSAPAVPAGAKAAGFTTLAANYDFTQTLPANWLGCYPHDGQVHQWYQGQYYHNTSAEPPCDIKQAFDSVAGTNVLDMKWLSSYLNTGMENYMMMSTMDPSGHSRVTDFPNFYMEWTYRVTPTVSDSPTFLPLSAAWSWGTQHAQTGSPGPLEYDTIETYGTSLNLYDSAWHNWSGNNSNFMWQGTALPANYDPTQYHKYATRVTGNGTDTTEMCAYVDDQLIACNNVNVQSAQLNQKNFLIIQSGQGTNPNNLSLDTFIKSIRVWSCTNWQTTMCNGTVLTGAP